MDTLAIDTLTLSKWREQPEFDYTSEFKGADFSFTDWLQMQAERLLRQFFGNDIPQELWYVLCAATLMAVAALVVYYEPGLFTFRRKVERPGHDADDDNIYGRDFAAETSAAMRSGNYRRAVRIIYLHTLRMLNDAQCIAWQPSKTPTGYAREWRDGRFAHMTDVFMRVRYGGFDASRDMAFDMQDAQAHVASVLRQRPGNAAKQPPCADGSNEEGGPR